MLQVKKVLVDDEFQNYDASYNGIDYWRNTGGQLKEKNNRKQRAVYLQDEYSPIENFTLTLGGRYDTFSDVDSSFSPRIAGVYAFNNNNILKTQIARAFRPSDFYQMSSTDISYNSVVPEIVDTIELTYIYKTLSTLLRSTLFYSKGKNFITEHDEAWTYYNADVHIKGVEIEAEYKSEAFKISSNLAFYDTHRKSYYFLADGNSITFDHLYGASNFALAPKILANIAMTLNPLSLYPTTVSAHYTGQKPRLDDKAFLNHENGDISAQTYWNIAQKIKGISKNLEVDTGIRNIFNKTLTTLYMPNPEPKYSDIPYMKRNLYINLSYKF